MSRFCSRRPGAALIVAVVALIAALSGTAYAGITIGKNSVGNKQLRNKSVGTAKLRNGAVSTAKLRKGAVTAAKLSKKLIVPHANIANVAGSALTAGHASSADTAGHAGSADTAGSAGAAAALTGVNVVRSASITNPSQQVTYGEADCPAGQYVIGGGSWTDGTGNEQVNSSWPTRQGATDPAPDAWGVWMDNNEPNDNQFSVYAICVSGSVASSYRGFHAVHK
jgi:hypothetical protein